MRRRVPRSGARMGRHRAAAQPPPPAAGVAAGGGAPSSAPSRMTTSAIEGRSSGRAAQQSLRGEEGSGKGWRAGRLPAGIRPADDPPRRPAPASPEPQGLQRGRQRSASPQPNRGDLPCRPPHRISRTYASRPAHTAVSGPGSSWRGGTAGRSPSSTCLRMAKGDCAPQGSCHVSSCTAAGDGRAAAGAAQEREDRLMAPPAAGTTRPTKHRPQRSSTLRRGTAPPTELCSSLASKRTSPSE